MEPLDNTQQSHRPSKRFIIRGALATLIIGVLLVVQTPWFRGLFGTKKNNLLTTTETVGQVVGKDSNGNGIPDWEEQLWGLDPTKITTNGVANKTIIEQRRSQLQTEDIGTLNETDRLARELFSITTALTQAGLSSENGISLVGQELGETIPEPTLTPHYAKTALKTVTTTERSLKAYKTALDRSLRNYSATLPEIEVIAESLETGNADQLDALTKTVAFYRSFTSELLSANVPISIAQQHLDLVNGAYGLGEAFEKMKELDTNGIRALVGLAEYRHFSTQFDTAAQTLTTFLREYDIL
jgi:hypothetical protein